MCKGPCLIGGTPWNEEVPRGPGYLADLAEGSGAGDSSRGSADGSGAGPDGLLAGARGRRNGYYPRKLETTFGQVDLKVPRDRESRYYPAFLKPYARRLVDVGEVAVALYAAGVSQRKAAEILSLLLGHRYSHETLSALTDQVLEAAGAFRTRLLPEEMAFVYLDGLSLKVFRGRRRDRAGKRVCGPGHRP